MMMMMKLIIKDRVEKKKSKTEIKINILNRD